MVETFSATNEVTKPTSTWKYSPCFQSYA